MRREIRIGAALAAALLIAGLAGWPGAVGILRRRMAAPEHPRAPPPAPEPSGPPLRLHPQSARGAFFFAQGERR